MSTRPTADPNVAHELARLLASGDGNKLLRNMAELRLFGGPAVGADGGPVAAGPPEVGIWEATDVDGRCHFVRSRRLKAQWKAWADVERIPPKSEKPRVVLIGESVAFGWFYSPYFTPARALASALGPGTGGGFEVVDLSRINLPLQEAVLLNEQALEHLEPDVLVHFTGNNWHPLILLPPLAQSRDARRLREKGLAKLVEARKGDLAQLVRSGLERIRSRAAECSVPIVFVVPEFNFAHWRDPVYVPWLENGRTGAWRETERQARRALADGDLATAERAAEELIRWDGGTGGAGWAILGACRAREGRLGEVRPLIRKSWDGLYLNPFMSMPRCFDVCRELLLEQARDENATVVDLEAIFSDHLEGRLPGYETFVDYCHMTAAGTRVAMAAVAEAVLARRGEETRPWRELVDRIPDVAPDVEAESLLARAFQGSSMGQAREWVEAWLAETAAVDPQLVEAVLPLCARQAPIWLTRDFEILMRDRLVLAHLFEASFSGEAIVPLAQNLGFAAAAALESAGGDNTGARFLRFLAMLDDEYGESSGTTDLLHPRHHQDSTMQRGAFWQDASAAAVAFALMMSPYDYYKAFADESTFRFVAAGARRFSLTYRVPDGVPGAPACVELNGEAWLELAPHPTWTTEVFSVDPGRLRAGVNELMIRWPSLRQAGKEKLVAAAERMENGLIPDLYPVYGEIHAFHMSAEIPEEDPA